MQTPDRQLGVRVRIRYRHAGAKAMLTPLGKDRARIQFNQAQKAVTPGQAAVCYQDERVVAAGWIEAES